MELGTQALLIVRHGGKGAVEMVAGRGRFGAARCLLEEHRAIVLLEMPDVLRYRRLGDVECLGRPRETARAVYLEKRMRTVI